VGHGLTPFIFRRSLYDELTAAHEAGEGADVRLAESAENALYYTLLGQSGFARARFSDQVLMVVNSDIEAAPARA
jgi:hypothetical protein